MTNSLSSERASAPQASFGAVATRGMLWSGGAQALRVVAGVASTLVVARMLSPDDYGVVAMVAPITAFVLLFQDLGLSQSIVQAKVVDNRALTSLFWINVAASVAISLVLLLSAPMVANFYSDVRVGSVAAATSILIMITGVSIVHTAILTKEMRFKSLAVIEMLSTLVGLVVAVVSAILLRNYWALWLGGFAAAAAQSLFTWKVHKWRPHRSFSMGGADEMIRFGGGLTGFNLVNYLVRNLDNILIARHYGTAALGLYDQSYKLMMAPMQAVNAPLSRVVLPVLAKVIDEPQRYRRIFLDTVRSLLLVLTPGLAVAVAFSHDIIGELLGDRWRGAGPIFMWLSMTGLIQPLANATGWLFISSGRTKAMFYWGSFSAVVTIAGFLVGIRYGAAGISAALFWTAVLRLPILFPWCVRGTSVRARDLYKALVEPLIVVILTLGLVQLLPSKLPFWAGLGTALCFGYLAMIAVTAASRDGRGFLMGIFKIAKELMSSRPKGTQK